jgi:hypothetical protein
MPTVVAYIAEVLVSWGFNAIVAEVIAYVAVSVVVSYSLGKISQSLAGSASDHQGPPSQTITAQGTIEPTRILYGQIRTSGVIGFYGTSSSAGGLQDYLWFVITLAGHQSDAIGDIWLDSTQISSININASTGAVTQGAFTGFLNIWKLLGSSSEVVQPDWDAAFTAIGSNHIGLGVTKIVIRMLRSTTVWPAGPPSNFQALVSGKRVYDPRLDSTNGGAGAQRLTDATTWTFSANPALCAADYMTGGSVYFSVATPIPRLGMGVPTNRVNWTFASAAANECDQSVALPASATQPRYVLGCLLSCGDTHDQNLNIILASMIGQRIFSQGQYRIYAGEYDAPGVSISDNDLTVDGYTVAGATTGTDLYNTVVATYFDPNRDWQNVQCAVRTQSTYVTADAGQTLLRSISLAGVTDEYRAQRICEVIKKQSRNQIVVTLNLKLTGVKISPWETFNLTLVEQGWQNKVFRAQAVEMDLSGRRIKVTAREETSIPYADPLTTDYAAPGAIAPSSTIEAPEDPTSLTALGQPFGLLLTWSAANYSAPGTRYEIWEYSSSTPFASATRIGLGLTGTSVFVNRSDTITHYYWVRAVGINGQVSNQYPGVTGVAGAASTVNVPFVARGNCIVSYQAASKQGGSSAWDSDVYSINSYPTCHVVWKANDVVNHFMIALNTDPTTDSSYTSLDYAMYCAAGTLQAYESGTNVASLGTYTVNDIFAITYDATTIRYLKNGTVLRSVTNAGRTFYMDSSFNEAGSGCNSLDFGPTTTQVVVDTPQVTDGAVTDVAVTTVAGPITQVYSGSTVLVTTLATLTIGPYAFASNVVLTATLYWDVNNTTASTLPTGLSIQIGLSTLTFLAANCEFVITPVIPASTDVQGQVAVEKTLSLAASTTSTYNVRMTFFTGASGVGIRGTVGNITLKAEVIKK